MRLLSFHALWSLLLVAASIVGHEISPGESYDRGFYLLSLPLGWLLLFVVLLPITALIAWLLSRVANDGQPESRTKAFIISVATWSIFALFAGALSQTTPGTFEQTAITLAIATPIYGILIPLPRATNPLATE